MPFNRERLEQIHQGDLRFLSVQYRLDDIWRQQRQPQDATDVGPVDFLGGGDLRDGSEAAILKQASPSEGAGQRFYEGAVGAFSLLG